MCSVLLVPFIHNRLKRTSVSDFCDSALVEVCAELANVRSNKAAMNCKAVQISFRSIIALSSALAAAIAEVTTLSGVSYANVYEQTHSRQRCNLFIS